MRVPPISGPRIISTIQRTFWPVTTAEKLSPVDVPTSCVGQARPSSSTRCTAPNPGAVGRRVHDDDRARRCVDLCAQRVEGLGCERVTDVARLLVPHDHRVDHLVVAARTRGVVRAVQHEVPPCHAEERVRALVGREEQRAQRLRAPLDRALGGGRGLVHVDAVRCHAHEHVGARARAELAAPRDQTVDWLALEVLGERRDLELVVVLRAVRRSHDAAQPWLGGLVVGAVHQQHPTAVEARRTQLDLVAVCARDEQLAVVGQVAPVRVRAVEVLGAHARAVGRVPPERGLGDLGRHTAPHHGVLETGEPEELRHLRDVTEHVGEVADRHATTELGCPRQPELQVAHDRLARHHELVHQDHPRSELHAPGPRQALDARRGVGADLEVVVDDRSLAVEKEVRVRGVVLEEVQQVVEQADEPDPHGLERRVPLPVPMGVGHDPDLHVTQAT